MRHIIITLALLLAPIAQASSNIHLKEANACMADSSYRAGNYEEAIAQYEAVLADGLTSADLYYNLGNAYYRTGQMGLAILNYERALRLQPGMTDARQNLELANSKTSDRITVLPKIFLAQWYDSLVTHISPSAWKCLVFIFFLLVCASTVVMILSHRIGIRKGALASLIASGLFFILAVLLLIASLSHFNSHSEAIVLEPSMAVKSSPELQSVDKLILHEGTKVSISESLSGWYKITLADGTTGWCQIENLERI